MEGTNSSLDLDWVLDNISVEAVPWPSLDVILGQSDTNNIEQVSNVEQQNHAPVESATQPKPKRFRTIFTPYQLAGLEREFHKRRYLDPTARAILARQLGLSERQIKVWFQNKRMKEKRNGTSTSRPPLQNLNLMNVVQPQQQQAVPCPVQSSLGQQYYDVPNYSDCMYVQPQTTAEPNYPVNNYISQNEWYPYSNINFFG